MPAPNLPECPERLRLLRSGWSGITAIGGILAGIAVAATGWGCGQQQPDSTAARTLSHAEASAGPVYPVSIRRPLGPPSIFAGTFDEKGKPVSIACATCHSTKPTNAEARLGTILTAFHQGLFGKHAVLSCVSCHNPTDGYHSLRLADGKQVPFTDVMTLCAQCHGPQFRDYQHGAHGGMTGYWDLGKGGRTRNNCIDCHDPHAPRYPTVAPAAGPHDRFLEGDGHE